MSNLVPDKSTESARRPVVSPTMKATCGHEDALGYLTGNPCGKCVRKAYRKAMGK